MNDDTRELLTMTRDYLARGGDLVIARLALTAAALPALIEADRRRLAARHADAVQGKPRVPYTPRGCYSVGEVIDHKTFGAGFVRTACYGKILVLFADGERTLIATGT